MKTRDIWQAIISRSLTRFHGGFVDHYNLKEYRNPRKPVVIFGAYPHTGDYSYINKHIGFVLLVWCGTDALQLKKNIFKKNIYHVALSKFVQKTLKKKGIQSKVLPITPTIPEQWYNPCPLGDKIYIYLGRRPSFYGKNILDKLKINPDKLIITYGDRSRQETRELYRKSFIGLRLTSHDGFPNTLIEMGLMGRKCVWNGDAPSAIHWENVQQIKQIINKELKLVGQTQKSVADAMRDYLDINWLNTDYYEHS